MRYWITLIFLFCSTASMAQPPLHNTKILVWANEAIVSVYSYDFANYRSQLQQASNYFTAEGWQAYIEAVGEAGTLDVVKDERYTVSAIATAVPVIEKQGEIAGQYTWEVSMPLLIQYQSSHSEKDQTQSLNVTITIVATSSTEGKRGLGITHFNSEPGSISELQSLRTATGAKMLS